MRSPQCADSQALWFFDLAHGRSLVPDEIANQFAAAGCQLQAWSGKPEPIPGVLMISEVTDRSLACVEFASDLGRLPVFVLFDGVFGRVDALRLLRRGALDVMSSTKAAIGATAARCRRRRDATRQLDERQDTGQCIGVSDGWRSLMLEVIEAAWRPNLPMLLTGQSGTGKEGVARLIHDVCSQRRAHQFVIVDCTTLRNELSGSELFGHVRGAFTGASIDRDGALCLANQGTLFLDEIGELPLPLQAELLRVLQERTYKPVGANYWKKTDFRLVSATNRDLIAEVEAGRFRADLFYRLAGGCHFRLPSLEQRLIDIPLLCTHFLREACTPDPPPELTIEVAEYLQRRKWPGNVRELRSLMHRMLARYCGNGPLTLGTVPTADRDHSETPDDPWSAVTIQTAIEAAVQTSTPLTEIGRRAEDLAIGVAVRSEQGNLPRAAALLQVSVRTLQLRIAAWRTACSDSEQGST